MIVGAPVAGCSDTNFVGRPDLQLVEGDVLPAPTREDLTVPSRPYVIGPSDQLVIDVYGLPELSRALTVDLSGQIALPLAGQIGASGLTATELSDVIAKRLSQGFVRDPRVTVGIAVAANQIVTVDGAVSQPGAYPVVGRMSLLRVIARASGTTEFARETHVVVFRRSGGREYATLYDLRAIRLGMYRDPEIYTNDVIVVGESRARRVFKDVLASSALITTPLVALIR
ncbi:polysaccharide biosynthesis/export family protein [Sphingomonas sp. ST-64]|uniref:Polysaccharide biosynthesis/export family protein n=1 Tax=Sphingomonas plantiphila TaxID=3163295 RepID=A0ABW8YL34_9SPHN